MNVEESYQELGLRPDCTEADLKAAWRRLAARWHPDRNSSPHALRKIQRINRALEEIRRAREAGAEPVDAHALDVRVELTVEEAFASCTRTLQGELVDDCAACDGSGVQAQPTVCPECKGAGQVRQPLWFGWMAQMAECRACGGQGAQRHACGACAGTGRTAAHAYRCRVRIPAGVRDGDVVHASAALQGRRKLALRVRVALLPHALFRLDADGTVHCDIEVDGFAWMAERWTEVATPAGPRQMRLRRSHRVYRIKGAGFPDCIVTVAPQFPEELDTQQEALVDRLIATNTGRARVR